MLKRYLFKDGKVSEQTTLYNLLTETRRQESESVVLLILSLPDEEAAQDKENERHEVN